MKKFVIALVTIFVLGNLSGAIIGARLQDERHEQRYKVENLKKNIMEHLDARIVFTEQQTMAIEPLVGGACDEIRGVCESGTQAIEAIILKYHDLIAAQLTPEQDKILKEMEAERVCKNVEKKAKLSK